MGLFDVYIAVDWSANSSPSPQNPSPDAIWMGEFVNESDQDGAAITTRYFRTRQTCTSDIRRRLVAHKAANRRVIIGFDFAYAYSAGFAASIGHTGDTKPWRYVWSELSRLIHDDSDNRNNRYQVAAQLNARCGPNAPGPYWGCPSSSATAMLTSTMKERFSFPYPTGSGVGFPPCGRQNARSPACNRHGSSATRVASAARH